jgi:hypothetical protein
VDSTRELVNPFGEDSGLPVLRTWTINGYPLFYSRQLTRRLNSAGMLTVERAERLGEALAERFPGRAIPSGARRIAVCRPATESAHRYPGFGRGSRATISSGADG